MTKFPAQMGSDLSPEDRKRFILDNADSVGEHEYFKPFSEEETDALKVRIAETSVEIEKLEDEKKEIVSGINESLKAQKTVRKESLKHFKQKGRHVTERCGHFYDEESRMVHTYSEDGQHVSSRKMNPGEMQKTVFGAISKGGLYEQNATPAPFTGTND